MGGGGGGSDFEGLAGWRLGDVLASELVQRLQEAGEIPDDWSVDDPVIVLSHECDLVHNSLDGEPHVEIVRATLDPDAEARGNARFGKSPRRYAIPVAIGGETRFAMIKIADQQLVSRELFADNLPNADVVLDADTRHRLADWRSRRYTRRALPNAFESRLSQAGTPKRIRDAMEENGTNIAMLLIAVSPEELEDGRDYDIEVLGVMRSTDYGVSDVRAEAQLAIDQLEAELNACEGIDCEAFIVSEAEITLEDFRSYQHWDIVDHLSRRHPDHVEPPL